VECRSVERVERVERVRRVRRVRRIECTTRTGAECRAVTFADFAAVPHGPRVMAARWVLR
jgi:hypothetical protein